MKENIKDNSTAVATAAPAPATLAEAREALAQQAHQLARLSFLVEASKILNSTLDLPELLGLILKMAQENTGADRGSLFLVDHERQEIWSLLAHGLEQKEIRLPMGKGIAGAVAATGDIVNLADAYTDPRFDRDFDQRFGYRTKALLCLPIKDRDDKTVGVLQLLNKRDGNFDAEDVDFLQSLSVHSAIALRYESSLEVGGDYYDFLTPSPNTFLFVVADVEGKGVGAAMIMSNLQATLHAVSMHLHSLEGIVYTLNESLVHGARSKKFMTFFIGLVDLAGRGLHYINAGHVPPVVVRTQGEPEQLKEGGMVLGLFPGQRYERGYIKLEPGDVILACTDGITEAANAAGDQFETERMVDAARANRQKPAQGIVEAIVAEVAAFERGGSHFDDKVMMALKVR